MKKVYITLIISFLAFSLTAQNRQVQDRGFMGANPAKLGPNFTTEQSDAIKALRFELEKEMIQVNNQIAEKRAQLKTLEQVDKPDTRAINSKIDEITSLMNKRMKATSANKAKIRSLLTDEQKVMFDKRGAHGKRGVIGNRDFHQRAGMQRGIRPGAAPMMLHGKEADVKIMRIERKAEAPVNN